MRWFDNKSKIDRILIIIGIMAFALLFSTLSSCLGTKKITDKETISTEKTEITNEKSDKEVVNKKIDDKVITKVESSGNPETDAKIDAILSKLSTSKSSGDNSYNFIYDRVKRELRAEFEIGETKESEVIANTEIVSEKSFEESVDEYVKKIVIPWWVYVIGVFVAWPYLKPIIMMFFGPANIITSVSNVLKPKNDNKN